LFAEAETIFNHAASVSDGKKQGESYFEEKIRYIRNFKKVILMCMHGAVKQFDKGLVNEQEVLNNLADMMMEVYMSESLLLRIQKRESLKGTDEVYRDILDVNIYDTAATVRKAAADSVNSFAQASHISVLTGASETLSRVNPVNIKDARRRIADKLIADNEYKF
jgi:hypothetical protein